MIHSSHVHLQISIVKRLREDLAPPRGYGGRGGYDRYDRGYGGGGGGGGRCVGFPSLLQTWFDY